MSCASLPDREVLAAAVHTALRRWHEPAGDETIELDFLLLLRAGANNGDRRGAVNRLLTAALTQLQAHQPDAADLLRQRFLDLLTDRELVQKRNISDSHFYRLQRDAINALADVLREQEAAHRAGLIAGHRQQLAPAPYAHFVGQSAAQERLRQALTTPGSPHAVVIAGLGGIGKTALADVVLRRLVIDLCFDRFVWIDVPAADLDSTSLPPAQILDRVLRDLNQALAPEPAVGSRQRLLDQARAALKKERALVVIDNVETMAAADELLASLLPLTDPARLLITGREQPQIRPGLFLQPVAELDQADSLALIRHEARASGRDSLAAAGDDTLMSIFDAVGGNPQALNLVVGMTDVYPLPVILRDVQQARLAGTAQMYRDIYWRVWQSLTPAAQRLLKAFVLAPPAGATDEHMLRVSGLPDTAFWTHLAELTARSLVKVRGDALQRRYSIHRLTESFLQTEIIQWPAAHD